MLFRSMKMLYLRFFLGIKFTRRTENSENIEKIGKLQREVNVRERITAELIAFERIRDNYKLYRHGISDEELADFAILQGLVDKDRMKKYE